MGGDESPHSFVSASLIFLQRNSSASIVLFGDERLLRNYLSEQDLTSLGGRLSIAHANDIVEPNDKPGIALRHKRQSSMWMAVTAVAEGRADAVVSAGNTGALMAIGLYLLGTLDGIDRPAICKRMPIAGPSCYVLDLGANLSVDANQLHQFALMGAALAEVDNISPVKVGLLNVGHENQKGTDTLQQTDQLLSIDRRFEYIGFVEGHALFDASANVIVCDGFAGNIALKACEGLARYLMRDLQRYFTASSLRRLLGGVVRLLARGWFRHLNPAAHNGALLLGLKGVVVKSHGGADDAGFLAAIQVAFEQAQRKPHVRLANWLAQ